VLPKVVIAICTRGRAKLLSRLLDSLAQQSPPAAFSVSILIIDNNDTPQVVSDAPASVGPFPLTVQHEGRAGLVYARNAALDAAEAIDAAWLVGVDDDEWVSDDWLQELTSAMTEMPEAKLLFGQRKFVYDEDLSPFYVKPSVPDRAHGEEPAYFVTANYAMHHDVFRTDGLGLRFDQRFNESGAEDTELFTRAVRYMGVRAAWLPRAIVFEERTNHRGALRFQLARIATNKNNDMRIRMLHCRAGYAGTKAGVIRYGILTANRQLVLGSLTLIWGAVRMVYDRAGGAQTIGRGLQRFALLAGILRFVFGAAPRVYGGARAPH